MRLAVVKKRFEEMRKKVFSDICELPKFQSSVCRYLRPGSYTESKAIGLLGLGQIWAEPEETTFMEFSGDFWKENYYFDIVLGSEACLLANDKPYAGLDENHRLVAVPKGFNNYKIEAYNKHGKAQSIVRAHLVEVNNSLYKLTNLGLEAVKLAEVSDPIIANEIEEVFSNVLVMLSRCSDNELEERAEEAYEYSIKALSKYNHNKLPGKLTLIPQSHIDLAWLWPEKETVRKLSRTFSTALRLSERYDEFRFHQSQPQLFSHVKEYYPELYDDIKKAIDNGKYEIVGGMWVEPDCNMPSGESFVRQILYGKKFFQEEFGISPEVEWLPDVFGFSPSLPQLFCDSGTKAFMTIKTGWNDTNKLPDSVFNWRGIDGSIIPTFIPRAINEDVTVVDILNAMKNSQRTTSMPNVAHLIGYGDGGGGVTYEQMEKGRLLQNLPGLPEINFGSIDSYVQENILNKPIKNTWDGELYLELHRGTTTTHAKNKKWNRKLEFKIRDVEILSSFAKVLGKEYPKKEIERAWKLILKNQMHDILPGSSINEVYLDSESDYSKIDSILTSLLNQSLDDIANSVDRTGIKKAKTPIEKAYVVFNTLSFSRKTLVKIGDVPETSCFIDSNGNPLLSQRLKDGTTLVEVDLPMLGYAMIFATSGECCNTESNNSDFAVSKEVISNGIISVSLGEKGNVKSICDLSTGEMLVENKEHHLKFFDDRPLVWDAWEIDQDFEGISWEPDRLVSVEIKENGSLCASLELKWQMNRSIISQEIMLYRNSQRVDFKTSVDWQERHVLFKTGFETSVRARYATYDVAFGKYQRPTFKNTSWERAQFEVPAHKWADLSDSSHGVSLINDCKYGYDVNDNKLRLTLLRSPAYPDKEADIGYHEFVYALYFHNDPTCKKTIQEAYDINVETSIYELDLNNDIINGKLDQRHSFIEFNSNGIVLDTIKLAEDSNSYILRFFESLGGRDILTDTSGFALLNEVNILEEQKETISKESLVFRPFQVKSFKIALE